MRPDNAAESPAEPGQQPDKTDGEQKLPAPSAPYSLPKQQPKGDSVPFHTGQDVVDNIRQALANDWPGWLQGLGRVVDATDWIKDQTANIVSAVVFYLGGPPYDRQDLNDAATKPSEPGSQDHHIVEQGPQSDDLSPEDKKLISDSKNIVRLPTYLHQWITNYYRNKDPDLGMTPREFLQNKSFEVRYQFGLKILREKFGVIQ